MQELNKELKFEKKWESLENNMLTLPHWVPSVCILLHIFDCIILFLPFITLSAQNIYIFINKICSSIIKSLYLILYFLVNITLFFLPILCCFVFIYACFFRISHNDLLLDCCCCCCDASVLSNSVQPHRRQSTRLPNPWDSPGKNTGMGCHFLLQFKKWKVKVKSLSRVRLLATPWTTAYQAPSPMGFSRQEYWSGLPLPAPLLD